MHGTLMDLLRASRIIGGIHSTQTSRRCLGHRNNTGSAGRRPPSCDRTESLA